MVVSYNEVSSTRLSHPGSRIREPDPRSAEGLGEGDGSSPKQNLQAEPPTEANPLTQQPVLS